VGGLCPSAQRGAEPAVAHRLDRGIGLIAALTQRDEPWNSSALRASEFRRRLRLSPGVAMFLDPLIAGSSADAARLFLLHGAEDNGLPLSFKVLSPPRSAAPTEMDFNPPAVSTLKRSPAFAGLIQIGNNDAARVTAPRSPCRALARNPPQSSEGIARFCKRCYPRASPMLGSRAWRRPDICVSAS
jgi:hypothetical protein